MVSWFLRKVKITFEVNHYHIKEKIYTLKITIMKTISENVDTSTHYKQILIKTLHKQNHNFIMVRVTQL